MAGNGLEDRIGLAARSDVQNEKRPRWPAKHTDRDTHGGFQRRFSRFVRVEAIDVVRGVGLAIFITSGQDQKKYIPSSFPRPPFLPVRERFSQAGGRRKGRCSEEG